MVGNCPTTTGEGRNSARKIEDSDTPRQKRAGRKSIVRSKVATAVGGLVGGSGQGIFRASALHFESKMRAFASDSPPSFDL